MKKRSQTQSVGFIYTDPLKVQQNFSMVREVSREVRFSWGWGGNGRKKQQERTF